MYGPRVDPPGYNPTSGLSVKQSLTASAISIQDSTKGQERLIQEPRSEGVGVDNLDISIARPGSGEGDKDEDQMVQEVSPRAKPKSTETFYETPVNLTQTLPKITNPLKVIKKENLSCSIEARLSEMHSPWITKPALIGGNSFAHSLENLQYVSSRGSQEIEHHSFEHTVPELNIQPNIAQNLSGSYCIANYPKDLKHITLGRPRVRDVTSQPSSTRRRHFEVSRFNCDFEGCEGRAFTRISDLARHKRTHGQERRFHCGCCRNTTKAPKKTILCNTLKNVTKSKEDSIGVP